MLRAITRGIAWFFLVAGPIAAVSNFVRYLNAMDKYPSGDLIADLIADLGIAAFCYWYLFKKMRKLGNRIP